ncbi:pilus assembly protein CpaB [Virgibacillus subterraneus]|uniref:Pilus assembly protein CpaB n=1 Tax=Virgibacillus subterraneus TaxID=621109 RepID=A0A1H9C1I2_9BACI|nr:SAF domain-containing protein [Virgibacillus subterraneus]SEP95105.1 pilus assembly protein CpaB [Virgibacillus subterraneus]
MLESKRKAIIFFLIALVLALVSGFLVLKKVQALNSNLGTIVEVYVANNDIPSRSMIKPEDITTDEIPKKYLRDEHITNIESLKNIVSVVPLSSGEIITKSILKKTSTITETDNRLITLLNSSEKIFFDQELFALDRVDIIISNSFGEEPLTEVFMKDVKVARVATQKKEFSGVQLEIPFEKVPELIHMQNYADSLRIVKSNVGQMQKQADKEEAEAENKQVIEEVPEKDKEKKANAEKEKKDNKE